MQLRDSYPRFEAIGAEIVAIGMGQPQIAAAFRDEYRIPFPLLVDPARRTYEALGTGRATVLEVAGPRVWTRHVGSLLKGHGVRRPQQDPLQLGGAMVVAKGGEVVLVHRAKASFDNVPPERLLEALQ